MTWLPSSATAATPRRSRLTTRRAGDPAACVSHDQPSLMYSLDERHPNLLLPAFCPAVSRASSRAAAWSVLPCRYAAFLSTAGSWNLQELIMAVRRKSQSFSGGTSSYRGVTHHPTGAAASLPGRGSAARLVLQHCLRQGLLAVREGHVLDQLLVCQEHHSLCSAMFDRTAACRSLGGACGLARHPQAHLPGAVLG